MSRGFPIALIAIMGFSVFACALSPESAPAVPEAVADAFADNGEIFVSIEAVATAYDAGMEMILLDTRTSLDFEFGHLPGAINVPYFDVEANLDRIPRDRWVVAYCECPNSEARQVYEALVDRGYTYVKVIEEGLAPWRDDMQRDLEYSPSQNQGSQG